MYRKHRIDSIQTQDSNTNNVGDLISRFEVRNYPINRGLLPEPTPGTGVDHGSPHRRHSGPVRAAPYYSPTSSPPTRRHRPYDSYLSDGAESEPPRRMGEHRVRQRPGTTMYYNNGSLSSLNESDYYEEMIVDSRSPTAGRAYHRYGGVRSGEDTAFLEEIEDQPLNKEQVASSLTRFGAILQMLSRIPFPRMSVTGMGLCSLVAIFFCPRAIGSNILFPGFRLLFGTLYPAYASYKAVRTKNVKEYVKWMMYWIVLAFFTCIETFTDILLSWFPFYYEIKVIIVLWLLSPATRGSSTLYRKFVHPMLTRREQEIDDYINQAKEKGYTAVLQLGSKGVNYATNVIMQTAIKGGGGLVQTLRKSYSLSDLSEPDTQRTQDEVDEIVNRPQRVLRSKSSRSSSGNRQMDMYFPEVEIAGTPYHGATAPPYNYIRSSDDISSGYSSAEPGLSRTASMSNTARPRLKSKTREDDEYEAVEFFDENEPRLVHAGGNQEGGGTRFSLPQCATIYELHPGGSGYGSISSLPAITQAEHTTDAATLGAPIYSSGTQASPMTQGSVQSAMGDKYKLFLTWMEEQQKKGTGPSEVKPFSTSTIEEKTYVDESNDDSKKHESVENREEKQDESYGVLEVQQEEKRVEPTVNIQQEDLSFMEDNFQDTISVSSNENDEFLEIENADSPSGIDEEKPTGTGSATVVEESPQVDVVSDNNTDIEIPVGGQNAEELEKQSENHTEVEVAPSELDTQAAEKLPIETAPVAVEPVPIVVGIVATDVELSNGNTTVEPFETSNLSVAISSSDLNSSSSSLAMSESSTGSIINLYADASSAQAKKHASFGKQRKAPPVPVSALNPPPEMVVVRERTAKPSTSDVATVTPKPSTVSVSAAAAPKKQLPTTMATVTSRSRSTTPVPAERSKPKKFMSSLTGMFKSHGEPTPAVSRSSEPSSNASGHPRETEI
ncbi:uncharacterized protein LOC128721362 [Anopheles nili]|uniref:uncharacterized protein LOC128721362 n=1 Tax=Anopheles nili TaxID=185578 RepID=UPI00237C2DEF|nr:uncharacterized protein LOC128721362 [Anopheles nili]